MFTVANLFLLLTGLLAAYLCWYFARRYNQHKALHNIPLFHGVAGLVIFLGPFFAHQAPQGFFWVGIGGLLIGVGGIALAFISAGSQLLFFGPQVVMTILPPLLLLMTGAFTLGFAKKG